MTLANKIKTRIEEVTGESIDSYKPVGGGCISDAQVIQCVSGTSYFLKVNESSGGDMFLKEAHGLEELKKAKAIRVPDVIIEELNFILLENIYTGSKSKNFFEDFGRQFAALHQYTSKSHGFYENNYIGSSLQLNLPLNKNWKEFYWQNRILYQLKLAEKNGFVTPELIRLIGTLETRLDIIMDGSENTPSLLHGDLWSGNYLADENGNPCLIDPAVYYGNREADLAMTKLFGGFTNAFYSSYNEAYPLPSGYEYRENFYKLYHILNHLNIFGSGYYSQAISLIKYYL